MTTMLLLATVIAGCSSGTDDAKRSFCEFLSRLNHAADSVTSPEQGLTVLKSYQPELERQLTTAPPDMRPDITTIVNATKSAIASGDLDLLSTDEVAQAGARLSSQCGLVPAGSAPPTT